jgi:mandelamide amidase
VAPTCGARTGTPLGPLHGIPLALKDNLDTAEMPTTGGTPGLRGPPPKHNAPIVQKLFDAGAIAFGKTNLHELAYGITNNNAAFGAARNPYDRTRIPGASSGGVGVAVAGPDGAGRHRLGHRRLGPHSRPRCAASSASGRPPGAGRRPASCRSRTRATPPAR